MTIELVDELDRPMAGFSGADSAKLSDSGTQLEVVWPKSNNNYLPTGRPFAVKVKFPATGQARVYALYVSE